MCDFKPGDEVAYIGPDTDPSDPYRGLRLRTGLLTVGAVYTVVDLVVNRGLPDDIGVVLREVKSPRLDGAFSVRAFRKVQKPKSDLSIESFLTIKPGFEEPKRVVTPKKENA